MGKKNINKIIYFDKETIRNILQEQNNGAVTKTTDINKSRSFEGETEASAKIKLGVPFISRLSFLFSGKMAASFIYTKDHHTTISSTELSEFESIKSSLKEFKDVSLYDIENSSTFLRVTGSYLKMVKGEIDGVDVQEFKSVMDSFDGYDTYKFDEKTYVRFNNSAFVSNYKRNDLLTTNMTIYCISVGKFDKDRFDFLKEINRMDKLINSDSTETLYDYNSTKQNGNEGVTAQQKASIQNNLIELFDVIYSCVNYSCEGQ